MSSRIEGFSNFKDVLLTKTVFLSVSIPYQSLLFGILRGGDVASSAPHQMQYKLCFFLKERTREWIGDVSEWEARGVHELRPQNVSHYCRDSVTDICRVSIQFLMTFFAILGESQTLRFHDSQPYTNHVSTGKTKAYGTGPTGHLTCFQHLETLDGRFKCIENADIIIISCKHPIILHKNLNCKRNAHTHHIKPWSHL